jgi:hypothetical protein
MEYTSRNKKLLLKAALQDTVPLQTMDWGLQAGLTAVHHRLSLPLTTQPRCHRVLHTHCFLAIFF